MVICSSEMQQNLHNIYNINSNSITSKDTIRSTTIQMSINIKQNKQLQSHSKYYTMNQINYHVCKISMSNCKPLNNCHLNKLILQTRKNKSNVKKTNDSTNI